MSVVTVNAWKCDLPNCGYVWTAEKEPARCSKCKRKNWNKGSSVKPAKAQKPTIAMRETMPILSRFADEAAKVAKNMDPVVEKAQRIGWMAAHEEEKESLEQIDDPITAIVYKPTSVGTTLHPAAIRESIAVGVIGDIDGSKFELTAPPADKDERFAAVVETLSSPHPKAGEKCPHGWSNWMQCGNCNPRKES